MARTATAWLNDLTDLYTPTSTQFDNAKRHRGEIQSRLDAYLGLHEMFEIGSLRHGTGVWRYSDADYLASLRGRRPGSAWTMLNNVKEALQGRYPSSEIVVQRPAVVCRFSDATVEVVPGYPDDDGYLIADPSTDGGWMRTYPKHHNQYVDNVNRRHGGAVKRLARQLKIWKYLWAVPISSCYLEMRVAKYMDTETSYIPLLDLYLTFLEISGLRDMNDPTGLGSRFRACSSEPKRQEALSKLERAITRSRKARDFADANDHKSAIEQLELLFNQ